MDQTKNLLTKTNRKENYKMRIVKIVAALLLASSFMYASGTTDTLGLASSWTKIQAWFSDSSITSIFAILMLIFAGSMFIMKQYMYSVLILIGTVILMNVTTVAQKFAAAGF